MGFPVPGAVTRAFFTALLTARFMLALATQLALFAHFELVLARRTRAPRAGVRGQRAARNHAEGRRSRGGHRPRSADTRSSFLALASTECSDVPRFFEVACFLGSLTERRVAFAQVARSCLSVAFAAPARVCPHRRRAIAAGARSRARILADR